MDSRASEPTGSGRLAPQQRAALKEGVQEKARVKLPFEQPGKVPVAKPPPAKPVGLAKQIAGKDPQVGLSLPFAVVEEPKVPPQATKEVQAPPKPDAPTVTAPALPAPENSLTEFHVQHGRVTHAQALFYDKLKEVDPSALQGITPPKGCKPPSSA